jgi:hypothetical protein
MERKAVGGSQSQSWRQKFSYDRYGNRNFDQSNTTMPSSFANPALTNPTVNATNNRFASGQGYSYDSSGNTTADAGGQAYVYDAFSPAPLRPSEISFPSKYPSREIRTSHLLFHPDRQCPNDIRQKLLLFTNSP